MKEEDLKTWYLEEKLSLRQVATRAGVSSGTVRYYMQKYRIPRRSKSEALAGESNPMYGKAHTSTARSKISKSLGDTNLDPEVRARRSKAASGENNPMFGRTHTPEVKQQLREALKVTRKSKSFKEAHLEAMNRPEVKSTLSAQAKQRTGTANPFFGRRHSTSTKAAISKANQGRFRGSKGSNWQGGKTKLALLIRNSEPAIRWRKAVFERDKYTCQSCGKKGGPLQADHIRPFAAILKAHRVGSLDDAFECEDLWDLGNGRTLCVHCHRETDSFAGNFQKNYG